MNRLADKTAKVTVRWAVARRVSIKARVVTGFASAIDCGQAAR